MGQSIDTERRNDADPSSNELVALCMPRPSVDHMKSVVEKRLDFLAQQTGGEVVATIEDSGLGALKERFGGNLHATLTTVSNSLQFAIEVEGQESPIAIDSRLVNDTLADIDKTLAAREGDEPGKLRSFATYEKA